MEFLYRSNRGPCAVTIHVWTIGISDTISLALCSPGPNFTELLNGKQIFLLTVAEKICLSLSRALKLGLEFENG